MSSVFNYIHHPLSSRTIKQILIDSCKANPDRYHIIIADSMPYFTGLEMVSELKSVIPSLTITYINITGVHAIVYQVTQVMIEATAMLANGNVQAPSGSAIIAMLAHTYKVLHLLSYFIIFICGFMLLFFFPIHSPPSLETSDCLC